MDQHISSQDHGESQFLAPLPISRKDIFLRIYLMVYCYYLFVRFILLTNHSGLDTSEFLEFSINMLIWPFMLLYLIIAVNGFIAYFIWIISPLMIIILSWYTKKSQRTKIEKVVIDFLIFIIFLSSFILMKIFF